MIVFPNCPHGLDLRIYPRCYLCDPLPVGGCQCPRFWWGVMPPPCSQHNPAPPTLTSNFTVRCTCPPDRGDNYLGSCPIHDVQVSYT